MQVLVVAAHPDDEVLGCGGTMALHAANGDTVAVVFMADGEGARGVDLHETLISEREKAACLAAQQLGAVEPVFLGFPDNCMDSVPLLDLVQSLEKEVDRLRPQRIYTHYAGDLNIDHRLTCQAVLTACRPQPECTVEEIFCFEVPSSTEWGGLGTPEFFPSTYADITPVMDTIEKALLCYRQELRPFPHARSMESIRARQQWRGATFGVAAAEVFTVERLALKFSGITR